MQRPKLRPYIDRMREVMAADLGIGADRVSVKATTTERLGFEGREEGVSVSAVRSSSGLDRGGSQNRKKSLSELRRGFFTRSAPISTAARSFPNTGPGCTTDS